MSYQCVWVNQIRLVVCIIAAAMAQLENIQMMLLLLLQNKWCCSTSEEQSYRRKTARFSCKYNGRTEMVHLSILPATHLKTTIVAGNAFYFIEMCPLTTSIDII